jgi:predicted metalloprotease
MKWEGREQSRNVEDRRGMGRKAGMAVGLGGLVILLIATLLGFDPRQVAKFIGQNPGGGQAEGQRDPNWKETPEEKKQADFTRTIFRDTEIVWEKLFADMGKRYEKPTLVLFTDQVSSACGFADAAVGPFYCPGDSKVYIDLGFYRDMQQKLNSPGEFARAYVVAHEVGHHVQRLLGYSARVDEVRARRNELETNRATVRLELQADYLAGVWAHHGQNQFKFLEPGDIETAINAAFEIGDDRLQKKATGRVVPENFTHGSSKQRQRWFMEGLKSGDVNGARRLFELPYGEL